MKTIAVIHPSSELYGADRILVNVCESMPDAHFTFFLPSNGPLIDLIYQKVKHANVIVDNSLPIIQRSLFSVRGIISTSKKLMRFRRRWRSSKRFDLVYVNTLAASMLLPIVSKRSKVITHVHEILEHPKLVARVTSKLAYTYSDKVVSVSYAVQENLEMYVRNNRGKGVTIHNGIDKIEGEKSELSEKLQFGLIGRVKPEKGQWHLVEALKYIDKGRLDNAHFHLVGGTVKGQENLLIELKQKIRAYNLEKYFTFHEFSDNIAEVMKTLDVSLIPSLMKDPFPTTVLEAMSSKKAIICGNRGGAKEAIQSGQNGLVVDMDDPKFLGMAIENLIDNPQKVIHLGKNALSDYMSYYTKARFHQNWQSLINNQVFPNWELLSKDGILA